MILLDAIAWLNIFVTWAVMSNVAVWMRGRDGDISLKAEMAAMAALEVFRAGISGLSSLPPQVIFKLRMMTLIQLCVIGFAFTASMTA